MPSGSQVRRLVVSVVEVCGVYLMITTLYCYTFCASRICLEPASVSPHEWPDDITKWPVSMLKRRLVLRPKQKKDRSDCDFSQESPGFKSRARPSCVAFACCPCVCAGFLEELVPSALQGNHPLFHY